MKSILYGGVILLSFFMTTMSFSAGITTQGQLKCSTWAQARKNGTSSRLEYFFLGLLNGLSLGSGTEFWTSKNTNLADDQVLFWFDRFCDSHPLAEAYEGAVSLINEQTDGAYTRRVTSQGD